MRSLEIDVPVVFAKVKPRIALNEIVILLKILSNFCCREEIAWKNLKIIH